VKGYERPAALEKTPRRFLVALWLRNRCSSHVAGQEAGCYASAACNAPLESLKSANAR
jgi:hypothetical protein